MGYVLKEDISMDLTRQEKSLLLYMETQAVYYGGLLQAQLMNEADFEIAERWNECGFVRFGRLSVEDPAACRETSDFDRTHWCVLSEEAWVAAHAERRARCQRVMNKLTVHRIGLENLKLGRSRGRQTNRPHGLNWRKTMIKVNVQLGDEARDTVSGFAGVCVARTEWLNGCWRMTLQPKALDKDGKPCEAQTFDDFQLEVTTPRRQPVGSKETGGPRDEPWRPRDPARS